MVHTERGFFTASPPARGFGRACRRASTRSANPTDGVTAHGFRLQNFAIFVSQQRDSIWAPAGLKTPEPNFFYCAFVTPARRLRVDLSRMAIPRAWRGVKAVRLDQPFAVRGDLERSAPPPPELGNHTQVALLEEVQASWTRGVLSALEVLKELTKRSIR